MELKLIPQAYRHAKESYPMAVQFNGWDGTRFPRAMALFDSARFVGNATVCAVVGHKWQDNGHAGPESGCIDIGCARCGFNRGAVTLY